MNFNIKKIPKKEIFNIVFQNSNIFMSQLGQRKIRFSMSQGKPN